MDDDASKEQPTADFNKIDLSQLQGFSFGTQWTKDKEAPSDARERSERPPREDRAGPRGGGPDRRDRRAFQKTQGDGPPGPPREGAGDRAPRRDGVEHGPGPRRGGSPGDRQDRGPYESPFFDVAFFPEDSSFNALVKTIRSSARTIELFEIARTVLGKPDRFVVVLARKARPAGAPEAPGQPLYVSVPDGVPFESEEAACAYVLDMFLASFYDRAEVEVEAPKGNFLVINKCGVTGELLGPPNYHRYSQLVQQHHASRLTRMPFEAFKARIETVRDPEAVNRWLEKMKKATRYTWKGPVAEGQSAPAFDTFEEAKHHLLTTARDSVVRAAPSARFHGKALETMPRGEILMAIEGAYERQLRFPLDTANQLRGRLRREHFTIFKKGSKGISYVCAVKRKFRVPGQAFSESIGSLIAFIEANPLVKAGEVGLRMLGIAAPAAGEQVAPEQREKIARIQGDLIWLVREGFVTEFIDGGLYAPPVMVEARKKEAEAEEVDPENFPEAAQARDAAVPDAGASAGAPSVSRAPEEVAAAPAAGGAAEEVAPAPDAPAPDAAPAPPPAAPGEVAGTETPPPPEPSVA